MKIALIIALLLPLNAYATKPKDLLGKWEGQKVTKSLGSTDSLKIRLVGKRLSDGSVQLIENSAPFIAIPIKQTQRYTFRADGRFTQTLVTINPLGSTSTITSGRGSWSLANGRILVEAKYYGIPRTGTVTVEGSRLNFVMRQDFAGKFSTILKVRR